LEASRGLRSSPRAGPGNEERPLSPSGRLEAGLDEDAGEGVITLEEYAWAVTAVSASSLYFAEDFPVLVPLRLRAHPDGAAEVFEWGEEANPGAALYVGEGGLAEGGELRVYSDQFNGAPPRLDLPPRSPASISA
jgi:hypothetical protein